MAGCTEAEIATITGHVLRDVRSVLDANYLHRDPALDRGRDEKARKENKISQPGVPIISRNQEKRNDVRWLGD
jgi:hypothetical protein